MNGIMITKGPQQMEMGGVLVLAQQTLAILIMTLIIALPVFDAEVVGAALCLIFRLRLATTPSDLRIKIIMVGLDLPERSVLWTVNTLHGLSRQSDVCTDSFGDLQWPS